MGKNDISWQDILQAAKSNFASTEPEPAEQPQEETKPANSTVLDIIFEKKGRGGKTATIISGFEISDEEIKELAAQHAEAKYSFKVIEEKMCLNT